MFIFTKFVKKNKKQKTNKKQKNCRWEKSLKQQIKMNKNEIQMTSLRQDHLTTLKPYISPTTVHLAIILGPMVTYL